MSRWQSRLCSLELAKLDGMKDWLPWVGEKGIVCMMFGMPSSGISINAAFTDFLKLKGFSSRFPQMLTSSEHFHCSSVCRALSARAPGLR